MTATAATIVTAQRDNALPVPNATAFCAPQGRPKAERSLVSSLLAAPAVRGKTRLRRRPPPARRGRRRRPGGAEPRAVPAVKTGVSNWRFTETSRRRSDARHGELTEYQEAKQMSAAGAPPPSSDRHDQDLRQRQAAFQALRGWILVIEAGEFVAVTGRAGREMTADEHLGRLDTPTSG